MEAERGSKKRKQPSSSSSSSNPFLGIFTRSKSQIHIHRHRSGRAWSDFACRRNRHGQPHRFQSSPSTIKPTRRSASTDESGDDGIAPITVKDLRSRRVFSPIAASVIEVPDIAGVKGFGDCEDLNLVDLVPNLSEILESCLSDLEGSCLKKVDEIGGFSGDLKPFENGEIEKRDIGGPDTNPNLCANEGMDNKGVDSDDRATADPIDEEFGEECVQTTPPDPDVFVQAEVNVNGGSGEELVCGTPSDGASSYESHGGDGEAIPVNINQRTNSTYRSKLVLNPRSRLKVFKTPGSISYRRLLPYLMDIAKHNSFTSRKDHFPKLEKGLEVKPKVQPLDSHIQEIYMVKDSVDVSHIKPCNVDCGTLPSLILSSGNPNLTSSERVTEEWSSKVKPSENTSYANPNLRKKEGNDGKGSDSDGAMSDQTNDDFVEECVQTTPSGFNVFVKADIVGASEEHIQGTPLDGGNSCVGKAIPANIDPRNDYVCKTKMVLSPCSRLKVFKTPGSVSYRRLLPYLMDVAKDNSFASRYGQFPKLEKALEVKPTVQRLDSHIREISMDKDTVDVSPSEPCNVDCATLPSVILNLGNSNLTSSESITEGCSSKVTLVKPSMNTSDANFNLCTKGNDGKGCDNDVAMSDQTDDDFFEECIQMTPADSYVLGTAEVNVNGRSREENVQGTPSYGGSSSCVSKAVPTKKDWRNDSVYKNKLVHNPCSRLKVFKIPGSVSYRRLLPCLMDITRDDSFASRNCQSLKLEKSLEVRPTVQLFDSQSQEISIDKSYEGIPPIELRNVGCEILPNAILDRVDPNSTSSDHITDESSSKVKLVISDKLSKLELTHDNASPFQRSDPQVVSSCSPGSFESLQGEVSHQFPEGAEKESKLSGLKFTTDGVSLVKGLSRPETNISSGLPHVVLKKGILKRNPRGCRGLCTCLNCASFRLHAERAFEFSKNQMLDAEEVGYELIKELKYLRSMLEKSIDASNNHAISQVNQVKEACQNASKSEEQAKARLNQMNHDLNNHCRMRCLQRPRVSFANYVEEKVDLKADMPSK